MADISNCQLQVLCSELIRMCVTSTDMQLNSAVHAVTASTCSLRRNCTLIFHILSYCLGLAEE